MAAGGNSASSSLVVLQLCPPSGRGRYCSCSHHSTCQISIDSSVSATTALAGVVVTVAMAAEVLTVAVLALSPYYILQLNHFL